MKMDDNTKWTIETYAVHNEALRQAEAKFQEERDRRYKEVADTKEKAQAQADQLSRDTQTYKDMKGNELREQLGEERYDYARKTELQTLQEARLNDKKELQEVLRPILEALASNKGKEIGIDNIMSYIITILALAATILIAFFK